MSLACEDGNSKLVEVDVGDENVGAQAQCLLNAAKRRVANKTKRGNGKDGKS